MRFFTAIVERVGGERPDLGMQINHRYCEWVFLVYIRCSSFFRDCIIGEIQYQYLFL